MVYPVRPNSTQYEINRAQYEKLYTVRPNVYLLRKYPVRIVMELELGAVVGRWELELGGGVGRWGWELQLGVGVGSWSWELELGVGVGSWSWELELGVEVGRCS